VSQRPDDPMQRAIEAGAEGLYKGQDPRWSENGMPWDAATFALQSYYRTKARAVLDAALPDLREAIAREAA
jgi:hypothetical protein